MFHWNRWIQWIWWNQLVYELRSDWRSTQLCSSYFVIVYLNKSSESVKYNCGLSQFPTCKCLCSRVVMGVDSWSRIVDSNRKYLSCLFSSWNKWKNFTGNRCCVATKEINWVKWLSAKMVNCWTRDRILLSSTKLDQRISIKIAQKCVKTNTL